MKELKVIGVDKWGDLIAVCESKRVYTFQPISQDQIDERNELETVKDIYGYLWEEAETDLSQDEYLQNFIDSEVRYGDGYFVGHDTSYIHMIDEAAKDLFDFSIETWECVGCGGDLSKIEFSKMADGSKPKRKRKTKAKAEPKPVPRPVLTAIDGGRLMTGTPSAKLSLVG